MLAMMQVRLHTVEYESPESAGAFCADGMATVSTITPSTMGHDMHACPRAHRPVVRLVSGIWVQNAPAHAMLMLAACRLGMRTPAYFFLSGPFAAGPARPSTMIPSRWDKGQQHCRHGAGLMLSGSVHWGQGQACLGARTSTCKHASKSPADLASLHRCALQW